MRFQDAIVLIKTKGLPFLQIQPLMFSAGRNIFHTEMCLRQQKMVFLLWGTPNLLPAKTAENAVTSDKENHGKY